MDRAAFPCQQFKKRGRDFNRHKKTPPNCAKAGLFSPRFSRIFVTRPQAKIQIGAVIRLSQPRWKVKPKS